MFKQCHLRQESTENVFLAILTDSVLKSLALPFPRTLLSLTNNPTARCSQQSTSSGPHAGCAAHGTAPESPGSVHSAGLCGCWSDVSQSHAQLHREGAVRSRGACGGLHAVRSTLDRSLGAGGWTGASLQPRSGCRDADRGPGGIQEESRASSWKRCVWHQPRMLGAHALLPHTQ